MKSKFGVCNFICYFVMVVGLLITSDVHPFSIGDKVVVQNTFTSGLNVRIDHRVDPEEDPPTVADGMRGTVLDGPEIGPKYTWYKVKWDTPDDLEGWSVDSTGGCKVLGTVEDAKKRDAIAAKLFGLTKEEADAKTYHDYNGYGCNPHNDSDRWDGYYGGHAGLDIQTTAEYDPDRNDLFYSLTSGTVIRADLGNSDTLSVIAVYNASDKRTTFYLHARDVYVDVEDTVEIGDPLGSQGNTGLGKDDDEEGAHVHIEVRVEDRVWPFSNISPSGGIKQAKATKRQNVDPIKYLYKWGTEENPEEDEPGKTLTIIRVVPSKDVNQDGSVNILDLLLVWTHVGKDPDAKEFRRYDVNNDGVIDFADVSEVINNLDAAAAPQADRDNRSLLGGIPEEDALLPNYPNPFNPETWIPYQLAKDAEVTVTIYDVRGVVVRQLVLGHKPTGVYHSRTRAAHWDGRNTFGEKVASGVYFYIFTAGDFTATRKMLIRK